MQNYFGEKAALYFEYVTFHTRKLFWIGVIGAIVFSVDMIVQYNIEFTGTCPKG